MHHRSLILESVLTYMILVVASLDEIIGTTTLPFHLPESCWPTTIRNEAVDPPPTHSPWVPRWGFRGHPPAYFGPDA